MISAILGIVGTLILFLFSLDLLVTSLDLLGGEFVRPLIEATSNPFAGLFIGLLITAMLQSSSATTAIVVALAATNAITIRQGIPVIMGANVGTTITAIIVSLPFINEKKEFRRAVSAGVYHCLFNLLTVLILFPLEYHYGVLSSISIWIGNFFSSGAQVSSGGWSAFSWLVGFLTDLIPNGAVLVVLAFVLLFGSILLFRKLISDLLKARSPEAFSRFFFRNPVKSFLWGIGTTAAIRSSTVTTSVVVPIVAKKIVRLREAAPFIIGANIGTTITAFLAAISNAGTRDAINIAIAHFMFNFLGMIFFLVIPATGRIPLKLSVEMGKVAMRQRLTIFAFIILVFFLIPFVLIYFNRDISGIAR